MNFRYLWQDLWFLSYMNNSMKLRLHKKCYNWENNIETEISIWLLLISKFLIEFDFFMSLLQTEY